MSTRAAAAKPPAAQLRQAVAHQVRQVSVGPEASTAEQGADISTAALKKLLRDAGGERDFATLPAATSYRIDDVDAARALLTQTLLDELAPALGLDPKRISIRIGADAQARTNAAGAAALQEGGSIYLHPALYEPTTVSGRYLLAHEAVHAVQRMTSGAVDVAAAELEADWLGRAFAEHRALQRPRVALAAHGRAAAADGGEPQPVAEVTPPITESVRKARSRELALIESAISGLIISDGDVFDVLQILDELVFATAVALIACLNEKQRYELADNINPVHIKKHRASVLACYRALGDKIEPFKAIDTSVLEELPSFGLSAEERLAALHTLQRLDKKQLADLLQSDNRVNIKRLVLAPVLALDEAKEVREREEQAAKDEAQAAKSRKEILAYREDRGIDLVLTQVRTALRPESRGAQAQPHPNPQRALELLVAERGNEQRFAFLAERMDEQGLTDIFLEDLPAPAFFDSQINTDTLLALLKARLASRNLAYLEQLLSYGVFDWFVRDYEAAFAYRLLRILPLSQQYRFRQRDNGKWFKRLMDNLPKGFRDLKDYQDIEVRRIGKEEEAELSAAKIRTEDGFYDAGQRYRQKLHEPSTDQEYKTLRQAFEAADEAGFTAADAKTLFRRLALLGSTDIIAVEPREQSKFPPQEPPRRRFSDGDVALREAIVRELDALGHIEKLFAKLPEAFLFSEEHRNATVKIMLSRDAARAQAHARELVSRGITDLIVKDNEAYLAFLIVKALPDDERHSFIENDPTSWSRINGEMSEDMRRSHALNMYVGEKGGLDRAGVLGQLALDDTWKADNVLALSGLLSMAMALNEHKFAFERSEQVGAYAKRELKPLVKKYRLYDKDDGPTQYAPEVLQGTRWYEEGPFDTLRALKRGLVFLLNNDLLLVTRSAGANQLDLNELQGVAGGDLLGVRLASPTDTSKNPQAPKPDPAANKLDLHVDLGAHALNLHLPELLIESTNIQMADRTVQSGGMRMKGLRIDAAYDTDQFEQPTAATLTMESLEIEDLLVVGRGSLAAVTRLLLQTLRVAAGTIDTTTQSSTKPRGGWYFPIPFLKTIGTLIYYLFKLKGWGTETPQANAGHGLEQIKAGDLSFSKLEVEGLSTSGGQNIRSIKVSDFALRVGLNRATMARARLASIAQRIKACEGVAGKEAKLTSLREEQSKTQAELAGLVETEKAVLAIQQKILHGDLSEAEQEDLQAKLDDYNLEGSGGVYIDVGRIEASGLSGTVATSKPIVLNGLHGEADSAALANGLGLGVITDTEIIKRLAIDGRPPALHEQAGDARLQLDIEEFTTGKLEVGGGTIPTAAELTAQLEELDKVKSTQEFGPDYLELERLRELAREYEGFARVGIASLTSAELARFRWVREQLLKQPALVIESIALTRAQLTVDLRDAGRVGLSAEEALVKGIHLTSRNLHIDEFYGKNLQAGANASGGLVGWLAPRKHLTGANAKADLRRLKGVRDGKSGIGVDTLTVTAFDASATRTQQQQKNTSATVKAERIEAQGLSLAFTARVLRVQLEQLQAKAADTLTEAERLKIKAIQFLLDDFQRISDALAEAEAEIRAGTKDGALHKEWAEQQLAQWQRNVEVRKLSIRDLNLSITDLGDIFDENYSFRSAMHKGVTFAGAGPGGQMISGATLATVYQNQPWAKQKKAAKAEGKSGRGKQGKHAPAQAGQPIYEQGYENIAADEVELGAVSGAVTFANDYLALKNFQLASLRVANLSYMGGGTSVVVSGSAQLTGLAVTARIETPLVDAAKPDGERRLSSIIVTHFEISAIELSGGQGHYLDYQDFNSGLHLTLSKGKLGGIYADNVTLEFPANPESGMLIRGNGPDGSGSARVDSAKDLQLAAQTGSGVFFNGLINAQTLKAGFVQSGAINATLDELSVANGHLKQGDLDAKLSLQGSGLRVGLLPGKHGYSDGVKKYGAKALSAKVSGSQGKTHFDAEIERAAFDVSDDGRTMKVESLLIPNLKLNRLDWENDKYRVTVPQGETITVVGLQLGATFERNPAPKPDESGFKRIVIHSLYIPHVGTRGMRIDLLQKGLTLSLPSGVSGGISDIYMAGSAEHPEGFVIEPNEGWRMVGSAGFTQATLAKLTAEIPGVFKASSRLHAEGFSMGFLNDGSKSIDLDKLIATEVDVTLPGSNPLKDTRFSMLVGRTKHDLEGGNAGFYAHGVHAQMGTNAAGEETFEASAQKAGLRGLRIEMPESGITLDIKQLELPQGAKLPSLSNALIPEAKITDAYFKIDDIMHMGEDKPKAKGPPSKIDPRLLNFLDTLNGVIDLVLHVPADYLASQAWYAPTIQEDFPLKIGIVNGMINFAKLEDNLLQSTLLDQAIDFEVDEERGVLYVQLDLKTLGPAAGMLLGALGGAVGTRSLPGILGGAGIGGVLGTIGGLVGTGPATNYLKEKTGGKLEWQLDPNDPKGNEVAMAERYSRVRLRTLAKPFLPNGKEEKEDPKPPEWGRYLHDFEIRIRKVDLSLVGESSIDLAALNQSGVSGKVRLGATGVDGLSSLRVSGNSKTGLGLGLSEANVSLEDLKFQTSTKNVGVDTGLIHVGALKGASLTFGRGTKHLGHLNIMPKELQGTITEASVQNLRMTWSDKPPDAKKGEQ